MVKKKSTPIKSVTITIPLHIAETLQGFIDGGIGSSYDLDFHKQMKAVLKCLDKEVSKHYKPKIKTYKIKIYAQSNI